MVNQYIQKLNKSLAQGDATEHTHRPALKALLEEVEAGVLATNEPKHTELGAVDFVVRKKVGKGQMLPVGYIEAKDIGKDLNKEEKSEQLKRYLQLDNLILTDYLEFRWYVGGKRRTTAILGTVSGRKVKKQKGGEEDLLELLRGFLARDVTAISKPQDLAQRMAGLCRQIDNIIVKAFEQGEASDLLVDLKSAFERTLLPDLSDSQFADMFAQTLAYGLFAARIHHHQVSPCEEFVRTGAAREIPKSNPFLRDLFYTIHSPGLDREPFIDFVEDVTLILNHTNIEQVLAHFGRRTGHEDPILHFYETFLAAYDPKERKRRGVYYTPEPVVSYIVRSVDILLKEKFGLKGGLADESTVEVEVREGEKFVKKRLPKVLILDPACGTGTFLYAVVDLIRKRFMEQNRAGEWPGYVRDHLIPRIYGFELQMAPYAVAHLKLAMQLAGQDLEPPQRERWAYEFADDERLNVYLTNSLEYTDRKIQMEMGFLEKAIAEEAHAAHQVKGELPIMVVMGNPPYAANSANKGGWIQHLIGDYFRIGDKPLGERNPKLLQDDYVKFIRFSQWRIDKSGHGIVGVITNHGYIDNPTFRGLRASLVSSFEELHVLDLHGNANKREAAPDGGKDENVFDIRQGVSIGLLTKYGDRRSEAALISKADLYGARSAKEGGKYEWLSVNDINTTEWTIVSPAPPFYLFAEQPEESELGYDAMTSITRVLSVNSTGVKTHRDHFVMDFAYGALKERIQDMLGAARDNSEVLSRYRLRETSSWQIEEAREALRSVKKREEFYTSCLYRPFDFRHYFHHSCLVDRPRSEVMDHLLSPRNLSLITVRQVAGTDYEHVLCSRCPSDNRVFYSNKGTAYIFPLYLYPDESDENLKAKRRPNLDPQFVSEFAGKLGLEFVEEGAPFLDSLTPPNPPVNGGGPRKAANGGESESPPVYGGTEGGSRIGTEGESHAGVRKGSRKGVARNARSWKRVPKDHWGFAREMRKDPSQAEQKLWQALRNRQLGVTFRRQHPIGPFIADFFCSELGAVIEVDGDTHGSDDAQEYDQLRDGHLRELGLAVRRYTNGDVLKNLEGVVGNVLEWISELTQETPPSPPVNGGESESPPVHGSLAGGSESPPVYGGTEGGSRFGPEDVFYYIYAIFHSPTYRERYKEFLKIDFPRVPLTSDRELFARLVPLGHELVQYHLLEHADLDDTPVTFPVPGDNEVGKVRYDEEHERVYVNKAQFFEGIAGPAWDFHVGGYQVCQKWLKDRKGRKLSHDDLRHYEKTVMALGETIRLMNEIDQAIPEWPIQ